jgi:hypothetical protein
VGQISVVKADGTTYDLGKVLPSSRIRVLKQVLAIKSELSAGSQQLYVLNDGRDGDGDGDGDEAVDLALKDWESVQVREGEIGPILIHSLTSHPHSMRWITQLASLSPSCSCRWSYASLGLRMTPMKKPAGKGRYRETDSSSSMRHRGARV